MCALQFASALEISKIDKEDDVDEATNKLQELYQLLVEKLD